MHQLNSWRLWILNFCKNYATKFAKIMHDLNIVWWLCWIWPMNIFFSGKQFLGVVSKGTWSYTINHIPPFIFKDTRVDSIWWGPLRNNTPILGNLLGSLGVYYILFQTHPHQTHLYRLDANFSEVLWFNEMTNISIMLWEVRVRKLPVRQSLGNYVSNYAYISRNLRWNEYRYGNIEMSKRIFIYILLIIDHVFLLNILKCWIFVILGLFIQIKQL